MRRKTFTSKISFWHPNTIKSGFYLASFAAIFLHYGAKNNFNYCFFNLIRMVIYILLLPHIIFPYMNGREPVLRTYWAWICMCAQKCETLPTSAKLPPYFGRENALLTNILSWSFSWFLLFTLQGKITIFLICWEKIKYLLCHSHFHWIHIRVNTCIRILIIIQVHNA